MTRFRLASGLAALAVFALAPPAAAQVWRYSTDAGSVEYRRYQTDQVVQTVNGREYRVDIDSHWRFSVTPERSEDGLTMRIVHDSLSIETSTGPPPDLTGAVGKPVVVRMSDRGAVRQVELPASLPEAAARLDLGTAYRTFYPVLPEAVIGPGDAWADTVTVAHDQNGVAIEVTRVNRYSLIERLETEAGLDWRVAYESTFDLEGSGEQQGRHMALSGHGVGRGSFWFRPLTGLYLGGSEESEMRLVAFVEEGGQHQMIPIRQRRDETVERID